MTKRQKQLKKAYNIRKNNISRRDTAKKVVVTARIADRMIKYFSATYGVS